MTRPYASHICKHICRAATISSALLGLLILLSMTNDPHDYAINCCMGIMALGFALLLHLCGKYLCRRSGWLLNVALSVLLLLLLLLVFLAFYRSFCEGYPVFG